MSSSLRELGSAKNKNEKMGQRQTVEASTPDATDDDCTALESG